ncbi:39S ribosomal protein L33, mitochondrial [Curvularia clavata]|uniref:Large ribosomal subunit protein bL33m n=1 Tax=Curvularia clavata TaxID=95742 RepID=A0A9Q8ZC98_CURCL|nr:39S ribosomal protein L33, mitochondrial [Curvularia clavata]
MAKKAKSRTIMVRLISMAMTGYYRTMQRPRAHQPLSMLKYDPIGTTPSFVAVLITRLRFRLPLENANVQL